MWLLYYSAMVTLMTSVYAGVILQVKSLEPKMGLGDEAAILLRSSS